MSLSTPHHEIEPLVFLTLGEGDFSYSLDLASHLSDPNVQSSQESSSRDRKFRLVATGIDSIAELMGKYRDTQFLLSRLKSLDESSTRLLVSIHHEVNAVDANAKRQKNETIADDDSMRAHHVIFNHPHIGTEDAVRHSRFLCHLFHSVSESWLLSGGLFHLTLVKGQYKRWECEKAASRHAMSLVDRCPFQTPPVSDPYYQHRRHQTGKGFASRAPGGSETFTFTRTPDVGLWNDKQSPRLAWYVAGATTEPKESVLFECSYCGQSFKEERSVKNHVKSKHFTDKKRKRNDSHVCSQCQPDPRTFLTYEALHDHIQAKHGALHTDLAPDWARGTAVSEPARLPTCDAFTVTRECKICGAFFRNPREEQEHFMLFVPPTLAASLGDKEKDNAFKCTFCYKSFREKRAQLQHENGCQTRLAARND